MLNVDVDLDAATFNSSSADYTLPAGADVLWAGLYWGANAEGSNASNPPDITQRNRVLFSTGGGYQTIVSEIPIDQNSAGTRYQGFAEVTSLVRQHGAGMTRTYTAANIQAVTGTGPSHYAGWSLIIVIKDPAEVARHLHVFDGFVQIDPTTSTDTTTVTGFRTPLAGIFDTRVGMVAYEGDLGSSGDYFEVNGNRISNTLNATDNFFNSTISRSDAHITDKNPNFINQLGFDIDAVDVPYASNIIANGDTSALLTFGMTGDWYYPGVLTFAIDIFDPVLSGNITKSMIDLNGGALFGDDEVEFTIELGNTGNDNATNVILTDPIPANTTFIPGSLSVSSGPNTGSKTDAAGDDQAEFDSANNRVIFRLGTGADDTSGGFIGIDEWTEVKFRVKVDSVVSPGTSIQNEASVDFVGEISGLPFTATSNILQVIAEEFIDLEMTKTSDASSYEEGDTAIFTLTVTNNGPDTADNLVVTDLLPPGLLYQSSLASQGSYTLGTGQWAAGSLAIGATATLTLTVEIDIGAAALPQPIINSASATADQVDTVLANNTATAVVTASAPSDLSASAKSVVDLNGGDIRPGDTLRYAITLTNSGGEATGVTVTDDIIAEVNSFNLVKIPTGASSTWDSIGGAYSNGRLTVTGITVPAGGSVEVIFDVDINSGLANGTTIDNSAAINDPLGPDSTPAAPTLTVADSSIPITGNKNLYLYDGTSTPNYKLSRTQPNGLTGFVTVSARGGSQTWILDPALAGDVTAQGTTVPVTLWLTNTSNQPRTRNVEVRLACSSNPTTYVTSGNLALSTPDTPPASYTFNLTGNLPMTCATGDSWQLTVYNQTGNNGRDIRVYAMSGANNSYVDLDSQNVINVDNIIFHTDSYANGGGSTISSLAAGSQVWIQSTVSDPFGSYDINPSNTAATLPDITITDSSGTVVLPTTDMVELGALTDTPPGTKTFEYGPYTIPAAGPGGNWTVQVDAPEGTELSVIDSGIATLPVVMPMPLLTIMKSASTAPPGKASPGEVITYTVTVLNSGIGGASRSISMMT